jgi:hypothetical protein
MFWLIIGAPFIVLFVAAAIAQQQHVLFRLVILLLVTYFTVDIFLFYQLLVPVGKSTDPLALALVAMVELLAAILLLAVIVFSRRKARISPKKAERST